LQRWKRCATPKLLFRKAQLFRQALTLATTRHTSATRCADFQFGFGGSGFGSGAEGFQGLALAGAFGLTPKSQT
jgi:hypothetical protein